MPQLEEGKIVTAFWIIAAVCLVYVLAEIADHLGRIARNGPVAIYVHPEKNKPVK